MNTSAHTTAEIMQSAITETVGLDPQELQETIGSIVVTSSADLKDNPTIAAAPPNNAAIHDAKTRTTVFLTDRIPVGQESSTFLRHTVLRTLREEKDDWHLLLSHVKTWRARTDPLSLERGLYDTASARLAYPLLAGGDRRYFIGAEADEARIAFVIDAAARQGVQPDAGAPYGTAQAWLHEIIRTIQQASEKLIGNSLPGLTVQHLVAMIPAPEPAITPQAAVLKSTNPTTETKDRATLYEEAKARADVLNRERDHASELLQNFLGQYPTGPMGLTPDHVKRMPEYALRTEAFDRAHRALRAFNQVFTKEFAKERRADRDARFAAMAASVAIPRSSTAIPAGSAPPRDLAYTPRELILERRIARLTEQLIEARSALECLTSPGNIKGWLAAFDKYEDVTDVVKESLGSPRSMNDALWEIKALVDQAVCTSRLPCSPYTIAELSNDGLATPFEDQATLEALSSMNALACGAIEGGHPLNVEALQVIADRGLHLHVAADAPAAPQHVDSPSP